DATGELAAGGINVVTARAADRREDTARLELVTEPRDGRRARAAIPRARIRVEGNQVELRRVAPQQINESPRMFGLIIHPFEHDVLEGDAAPVLLIEVVPARLEQLGDRVLAVD